MKILLRIVCFTIIGLSTNAQTTLQKTFGGSGEDNGGQSIQQTFDGGYIILGLTTSFSGTSFNDIYLIKTNVNGDTLWTKTYGGTNNDNGLSIQQTTDSGYVITGTSDNSGAGLNDIYLIKTDNLGDTLWTKLYGGTMGDGGSAVHQTPDGGYVIAGWTGSYGVGYANAYLIKTNSTGAILWTKTYGGNSVNGESGIDMQITTDGGYIILGHTWSFGAGSADAYLIKTNSVGDTLWTKAYGGVGYEQMSSVEQTADGGYIIGGESASFGAGAEDIYLIKIDPIGNVIWAKTYGGTADDGSNSVKQTVDGGYIIAGYTYSFGAGNSDALLIKTNSNGDTLWTNIFGGTSQDMYNSILQNVGGGYSITGQASSFGTGLSDVLLVKTDSIGNLGCNQNSANIIVGNTATIINPTATLIGTGGIANYTSTIVKSVPTFDSVLCFTSVSIKEENSNYYSEINIYPNPFTSQTTISFSVEQKNTIINITDLLGKEIKTINFTGRQLVLDKAEMKAGVYFVQTTDEQKHVFNKKIVIQ